MILHYKQERSGPPTTPANNPEPVPVRGFTIGECMNFYRNVVSHTLGNGMRIFVLPRPGSPVEVECFVKTGSIHEGDSLGSGLSHFLEHMLFQGCRNYPGTAAADTIDRLGGSINAYTSFDHTAYHAHLAGIHLETAIDVLAAMVRHPAFPAERFAAEREVILREQELGADNPDRKLFETLNAEVFKLHPVRCPIIGFRHLIAGVTRDRVAEYWRRRYTPGRIFWVVVGNADPGRVCDAIGERLGDWQDLFPGEPALPVEPEQCIERHTEFCFSDPLARLAAGIRTPAITHRAIPALDVLAGILGMGESSRLVRLLEREKQLAVDLRTFCYAQPFGGILGITAAASPGNSADSRAPSAGNLRQFEPEESPLQKQSERSDSNWPNISASCVRCMKLPPTSAAAWSPATLPISATGIWKNSKLSPSTRFGRRRRNTSPRNTSPSSASAPPERVRNGIRRPNRAASPRFPKRSRTGSVS